MPHLCCLLQRIKYRKYRIAKNSIVYTSKEILILTISKSKSEVISSLYEKPLVANYQAYLIFSNRGFINFYGFLKLLNNISRLNKHFKYI